MVQGAGPFQKDPEPVIKLQGAGAVKKKSSSMSQAFFRGSRSREPNKKYLFMFYLYINLNRLILPRQFESKYWYNFGKKLEIWHD